MTVLQHKNDRHARMSLRDALQPQRSTFEVRPRCSVCPASSKPTVSVSSGAAPYQTLASFAQVLGSAGCSKGVTYTLSPDKTNYYYYNGSNWITSDSTVAQSTAASLLTSSAITAWSNLTGPQARTYFQAFLASDGNVPCALQSVIIAGTQ